MWFSVISVAFILPIVVADKGLLVSVLPGYINYGGVECFVGPVNKFSTGDNIDTNWFEHDSDILDMVVDARNKSGYLMDGYESTIFRIDNVMPSLPSSMKVHPVFPGLSYTVHGKLAYDWLAGNLYWSDSKYNWIAMQSRKMEGSSLYTVILHEGLETPAALAVDPVHYYLFFSEHNKYSAFIYRAALDGSDRTVIFHQGAWIIDIAVDIDENKIYWVDNEENAIFSSNFDGGSVDMLHRKTEYKGLMGSIDVIMDTVVTVEFYQAYILTVDKQKGQEKWHYEYSFWDGYPWVGRVYDESNVKLIPTPCDGNKCSQICINKDNRAVCMCADGFQVAANDSTACVRNSALYARGILVANNNVNGSEICMIHKSALTTLTSDELSKCFFVWNATITHMIADANRSLIFFSDKTGVFKFDAMENITTIITPVINITGLAYDWNARHLYWSEISGAIRMMSTAPGTSVEMNIYTGLLHPSSLTIDPHNDQLFWISEQNGEHKIQGGTFSKGSIRTLAEDSTLDEPKGLYYDVTSRKIFWINSKYVKYMNDDGSKVKTIHTSRQDSMLVVFKDYAVQTNGKGDFLVTDIEYEDTTPATLKTPQYSDMTAIAVFDATMQRAEIGPCEINNGDCEQFCIPTGNNQRRCACGNGYIRHNLTACTSQPKKNNFILTVDYSHKEIFQIDTSDPSNYVAIDIKQPITPFAAIYDLPRETVYWSDVGTNDIRRSNLYGKNIRTLYNPGEVVVHSMVLDPSTGLIFFGGDSYSYSIPSFIGVLHPSNGKHKKIITDLVYAYSVVVYPSEALLFYIDVGFFQSDNRIGKAKMDGSSHNNLISSSLTHPRSLALGIPASGKPADAKLFWSDSEENAIYHVNLDGTNKQMLFEDPSSHIVHIAVSGAFLYYTASNNQYITKLDTKTSKTVKWMDSIPAFGRLQSLEIYPSDPVPVHPACSVKNGLCSTFCLPSTNKTAVCACEDGVALMNDWRTCANVKKCSQPVMNGQLSQLCTGYVNDTCQYTCHHGYQKTSNADITCLDSSPYAHWNVDVNRLCVIATTPKTTTPTPRPTTPVPTMPTAAPVVFEEGITTPVFTATILGLIVLFLVVLFLVMFAIHKRRGEKMFAHAKFVNSQNFHMDSSNEENNYTTIDKHSRGDGMENPLYAAKSGLPKDSSYDNTMRHQDQVTLDAPMKF